jgi:hypothetical protein
MIIGTFNGANIIQCPNSRLIEVAVTAHDATSVSQSPWSGATSVYNWAAQWWTLSIAFPAMTRAQAQPWQAFLLELQGNTNVFLIGNLIEARPLGSYAGTGMTFQSATTLNSIVVAGLPASANNLFLPGDSIQIGYRLYKILEAVNSNGTGGATLSIFPQLRDTPAAGTPIITTNTQGLFRLAKPDREWSYSVKALYTFPTLQAMEAL